jgi:hypothetical protein
MSKEWLMTNTSHGLVSTVGVVGSVALDIGEPPAMMGHCWPGKGFG